MHTRPEAVLGLVFILLGCTGSAESILVTGNALVSTNASGHEALPNSAIHDRSIGIFSASRSTESHILLTGPVEQLALGTLVELVPGGDWPGSDNERPTQALLRVTQIDEQGAHAIVLGSRDTIDLDELVGRTTVVHGLSLSKATSAVTEVGEGSIGLAIDSGNGTEIGDRYFILGDATDEPTRLGSHIVAMVQVTTIQAGETRAQILHQMAPIQEGALAIFAQHIPPDTQRPEALILFLRTAPDEPIDDFNLPLAATSVIDYMAEFGFSNIRIQSLDEYIDPASYNATELAQAVAPDEGFGVLVFGHEREDDFLYNITTYGSSPSMATSVGILPGGLPLQTPDGVAGLSTQLAPSFLATAMTQRGDHAEVIYLLEYCLRTGRMTGDAAFHASEHLALPRALEERRLHAANQRGSHGPDALPPPCAAQIRPTAL